MSEVLQLDLYRAAKSDGLLDLQAVAALGPGTRVRVSAASTVRSESTPPGTELTYRAWETHDHAWGVGLVSEHVFLRDNGDWCGMLDSRWRFEVVD